MNDVNLFNDSTNIRHSKLSNNPNVLHEEGKFIQLNWLKMVLIKMCLIIITKIYMNQYKKK